MIDIFIMRFYDIIIQRKQLSAQISALKKEYGFRATTNFRDRYFAEHRQEILEIRFAAVVADFLKLIVFSII